MTSAWKRLKRKLGTVSSLSAREAPSFRRLFFWPSIILLAVLILTAILGLVTSAFPAPPALTRVAIAGLALTGIVALAVLLLRLRAQLLKPISQLRDWAARLHSGSYGGRIPDDLQGGFAQLARDLNDLGDPTSVGSVFRYPLNIKNQFL